MSYPLAWLLASAHHQGRARLWEPRVASLSRPTTGVHCGASVTVSQSKALVSATENLQPAIIDLDLWIVIENYMTLLVAVEVVV